MFTGIITNLGKLSKKEANKLTIKADRAFLSKLKIGMSISLNGVCLTVVNPKSKEFEVDIMPETVSKTNIKYLLPEDLVNLELPATPNTFLSGHIVQGHVDGVAKLENIKKMGNSHILKFSIPTPLAKFIVEKGSIAINGISLTVIEAGVCYFAVGIVPYTWEHTMLHTIKIGDRLNIEVDILAKYIWQKI